MIKRSQAKAAGRIDLAGGTLDLWPLYLYFGSHQLSHMAIDLCASCFINFDKKSSGSLRITIESSDLNKTAHYSSLAALEKSLSRKTKQVPTRWINRVVHYYLKHQKAGLHGHFHVRCASEIPPSSGLGGSSVLAVAIAKALENILMLKSKRSSPWQMQERLRNLEAAEIEHPAGEQDYVPALFGGLLNFHLGNEGKCVQRVSPKVARSLASRLLLVYTGKPHHSGINNWQIFKAVHGTPAQRKKTLAGLEKIHGISEKMCKNLSKGRLAGFPDLLNKEWEARRKLAPAVDSKSLERAWRWSKQWGATARKACGAGGGGCLLVYFPSEKLRNTAVKDDKSPFELFPVKLRAKA